MNPADEVGGDYYDFFQSGDYSWIVLGDVTGHGVGSGLVMFMVQSIISSILHTTPEITQSELNYRANQILSKNLERLSEQRPMTIITLRTKDGKFFDISGNHDNIHIYRAKNNEVETKTIDHIPFGIGLVQDLEPELFQQESFSLSKNDILFIATDGIVEAQKNGDYNNEQFEEERLKTIIKANASEPVEKLQIKLISTLNHFTKGIYHDDITFIAAKCL